MRRGDSGGKVGVSGEGKRGGGRRLKKKRKIKDRLGRIEAHRVG